MSGEIYREQEHDIFREFTETHYAGWVAELSRTVHSPLWIEDADGVVIVPPEVTDGPAGEHDDATSTAARYPIQAGDTIYGRVAHPVVDPAADAGAGAGPETVARNLAEQIGRHFVSVIDLDRMTGQLADSFDEINLLYRFSKILRPDASILTTFRNLMAETADLLAGRILILLEARKQHFEWAVAGGAELNPAQEWLIGNRGELEALFATVAGSSSRDGLPSRIPGGFDSPHGEIKYVISPVRTGDELTGYVGLFRKDTEIFFETGELRLLECLSEELSSATTSRHLYQELQDMLFNTVKSLVAAVDAKDEYTRGHSERVYEVAIMLGERIGLDTAELRDLSWAALLHDVGKIAIGRDILNKPSRLSNDEFAVIKTHPDRGVRVLEPIPQLQHILPAIRHHHERFDGHGYPQGLKGMEIPLASRILAVADTFDAMASSRAYRPAQDLEVVLAEIRRCSGSQFDPEMVTAFLELAEEGALDEIVERQGRAHEAA